jgi:hypothetical protein
LGYKKRRNHIEKKVGIQEKIIEEKENKYKEIKRIARI